MKQRDTSLAAIADVKSPKLFLGSNKKRKGFNKNLRAKIGKMASGIVFVKS